MSQYLILHKVRGEPSFDCAEEIEPGMWITNSGYRAYPYRKWPLGKIACVDVVPEAYEIHDSDWVALEDIPADWPDHFEVREAPPANKISDIAGFIRGLMPKMKVHRRF